jgi:DnaJ homolog subfamily C member 4
MFQINHLFAKNLNRPLLLRLCRHKTHYEVLKLSPNCTQAEIRDAFIKFTKLNHPDTSPSDKTTSNAEQFTEIVEAYRVLGKPDTRNNYDISLTTPFPDRADRRIIHEPWKIDPLRYTDPNQRADEYYGISGVRKVSNKWIVYACLVFAGIGISIQVFAIRNSATFKRQQMDLKSVEYAVNHAELRAEVAKYGNEMQLKRILSRLPADK